MMSFATREVRCLRSHIDLNLKSIKHIDDDVEDDPSFVSGEDAEGSDDSSEFDA